MGDVILTALTVSTLAVQRATATIPIVFTIMADPVGDGLVASLARLGGNITGVSNATVQYTGKGLDPLVEAAPGASPVGYLWNPGHPRPLAYRVLEEMQRAAGRLGVEVRSVEMRAAADPEPAFAAMSRDGVGGWSCSASR